MVTTIDAAWSELSNKLVNSPNDFSSWEQLISLSSRGLSKISTEEDFQRFRITYQSLLSKFPNLEQYWVNYALLEFKLGFTDNCLDIFEKALIVMPTSFKVWIEYLNFMGLKAGFSYEAVLKKYQEAEKQVGDHYHSFQFWVNYLNYEKLHNGKSLYYYNLFKKILELPIYHYAEIFGKWFKEIESMTKESVFKIVKREELPKKFKITEAELSKGITDALLADLKVKIKKIYTDVYITTQYKSHELFKFESQIKLEYFTPNIYKSYQELTNWGQYLIFISKHPSNYPQQRVKNLFERCLISCASYPQFWIQYAEYFLKKNQTSDAKNTLYRSLSYLNESNNLPVYNLIIDIELSQREFHKARDILVSLLEYREELNLELYVKLIEVQYAFHFNDKIEEFKQYLKDLFDSGSLSVSFQLHVLVHIFEYFKDVRINNMEFLSELDQNGKFGKYVDFQMIKLKAQLYSEKVNVSEVVKNYIQVHTSFQDDEDAKDKLDQWYEMYLAYEENNDPLKLFELDCTKTFADV